MDGKNTLNNVKQNFFHHFHTVTKVYPSDGGFKFGHQMKQQTLILNKIHIVKVQNKMKADITN